MKSRLDKFLSVPLSVIHILFLLPLSPSKYRQLTFIVEPIVWYFWHTTGKCQCFYLISDLTLRYIPGLTYVHASHMLFFTCLTNNRNTLNTLMASSLESCCSSGVIRVNFLRVFNIRCGIW